MKSLKILLIEDDKVDAMHVSKAFEEVSIVNELIHAENGVEAKELIESGRLIPGSYIILLDLNMPMMNGYEFLDWIREHETHKPTPIVILTTSADPQDIEATYKKFVAGYIVKPVSSTQFIETMSSIGKYWSLCELP